MIYNYINIKLNINVIIYLKFNMYKYHNFLYELNLFKSLNNSGLLLLKR